MTDTSNMNPAELAKKQAIEEFQKERMEAAKEKLKTLYRKLDSAKKVIKNIGNEITDLEMDLQKDLA